MKRLDILIVGLNYSPEPTGIAPYTTGMAHAFAEVGHQITVVTGFPHYPRWRSEDGCRVRRQEWDGPVRITRVPHPVPRDGGPMGRIAMEAVFATAAARVVPDPPDVVVAVSPALLGVAAAQVQRRRGRRAGRTTALGVVVQDLYGAGAHELGGARGLLSGIGPRARHVLADLVARTETALLRRADGILTVHEVLRDRLVAQGIPGADVDVVHNWTHVAAPVRDRDAVRSRLGLRPDRHVVMHAGNMGAKQGLDGVVEAARLAEGWDVPVEFVLVGDGNQRDRIARAAEGCSRIRLLPPVPEDDFPDVLAAADVLLLHERPGLRETCAPSKLTSYFAAGRPIVAATDARSPAAADLRTAGAGVVVGPGDPGALLSAIERLIGQDTTELGHRGRDHARERCSAAQAHAGYLGWLDRLYRSGVA